MNDQQKKTKHMAYHRVALGDLIEFKQQYPDARMVGWPYTHLDQAVFGFYTEDVE